MAWSPQARRAAILARKRKARGRAKPQYGVAKNGKKMTPAQRKKAGIKPAQRATKAIVKSDQRRRQRLAAAQSGKTPPRMTRGERARSGALAGAVYGGLAGGAKGAAIGAATGAAIGAATARRKKKVKKRPVARKRS